MGAGRQRAARRPAQHDVGAVAAQRIGHVGVPVADGRDLDVAGAQAVGVEEPQQRVEHEQGLALVGCALGVGADHVVRGR